MLDSFSVGSLVELTDFYYLGPATSKTLYSATVPPGHTFNGGEEIVDLGQVQYTVTDVTSTTLTISVPPDAPAEVIAAWAAMSGYVVPEKYASGTKPVFFLII